MSESAILVTGATGQQGGAVARHLLAAGFTVRMVVRNLESPASRALVQQGAQAVLGDFAQPESLRNAMSGVRSVFSVQPFLRGKAGLEVEWGKRVADAAAARGVSHFVYASVLGAGMAPDVPHFASKAAIENHIRSIGLPYTILQPAGFMENLLMPIILKGISKGKLTAPNAVDCPQRMIAVEDIGAIAAKVFASRDEFLSRTIPLVGDIASTRTQAATLSRVLGRTIRAGKLPGLLVRAFLGGDLYRMFRWLDEKGETAAFDLVALRSLHPGLLTFEQWCRKTLPGIVPDAGRAA
jgi:uncharacterized protein YbjT (DUF2867 family)